ncbi:MAG: Hpt domain-containing protein [Acidobacteriota bacterium]
MARADLLRIFFEEASRHLTAAHELTQRTQSLEARDWNELFRALHSVKGMAAALGYEPVMTALHAAESEVDAVRTGARTGDSEFLLELSQRVEAVQIALRAMEEDPWYHREPGQQRGAIEAVLPSSRVEAARLDRLLEIALRLSAAHQRLEHLLGPAEESAVLSVRDALSEAVRALRREVLELRLAPVQWLVPLLDAALQRWAQARNVSVQLLTAGETVQVDRLILESMLDPLGQILRNAVVHGIESPADRELAGKPRCGTIRLTVERAAESLRLIVADDGRGIASEIVRERARQRGHAAFADGPDPLMLLTLPGMTAQASADLLSGRGMGLGAARDAVERWGGTLKIDSNPGAGFQLALTFPTRIAVLPLFLVEAGGQIFGIPVSAVREIRTAGKFRRGAREWTEANSTPLTAALGARDTYGALTARAALVVGEPAQLLLVDRVLGRRELVCRPLGAPLEAHPCLTGAALLAEGGLALVIDPAAIVRRLERTRGTIPA